MKRIDENKTEIDIRELITFTSVPLYIHIFQSEGKYSHEIVTAEKHIHITDSIYNFRISTTSFISENKRC